MHRRVRYGDWHGPPDLQVADKTSSIRLKWDVQPFSHSFGIVSLGARKRTPRATQPPALRDSGVSGSDELEREAADNSKNDEDDTGRDGELKQCLLHAAARPVDGACVTAEGAAEG